MPINFDNAFGIHADALMMRSRRAEVLANNIANVDTPNYKARDFNFKAALEAASSDQVQLETTNRAHLAFGPSSSVNLQYRQPLQPSADGNTVDGHIEKTEFMRNSMMYSAGLTFLGARINGLLSAVRGGQ